MQSKYKLRANWSKKENDVMLHYPLGVRTKSDGSYLCSVFTAEFVQEMKDRGYDITKMKFEIPIKQGERLDKFETLNEDLSKED